MTSDLHTPTYVYTQKKSRHVHGYATDGGAEPLEEVKVGLREPLLAPV